GRSPPPTAPAEALARPRERARRALGARAPSGHSAPSLLKPKTSPKVPKQEANHASRAFATRAASARVGRDCEDPPRRRCARPYARDSPLVNLLPTGTYETRRNERRFAIARECVRLTPMDENALLEALGRLEIETPSWGYGNSGTRFHVYPWPGAARHVYERIADAALVHRLTGCCPSVAVHIPWDAVDDYAALGRFAEDQGVRIGAVNPNLFGDDSYRLGSICHPHPDVRAKAVDRCLECIDIAGQLGSAIISLWLADGTNYPGQDDLAGRHARLVDGLVKVYSALPDGMRLLVEYKFFEPAFYSTDLPDWGTAALVCRRLGPKARVLVDTGHHPQGTNIEQIVAVLLSQGLLGGFHFNNRKYADDDLIVGAIDPFELFRITYEIARVEAADLALMIDQSPNVEG